MSCDAGVARSADETPFGVVLVILTGPCLVGSHA